MISMKWCSHDLVLRSRHLNPLNYICCVSKSCLFLPETHSLHPTSYQLCSHICQLASLLLFLQLLAIFYSQNSGQRNPFFKRKTNSIEVWLSKIKSTNFKHIIQWVLTNINSQIHHHHHNQGMEHFHECVFNKNLKLNHSSAQHVLRVPNSLK